MRRDFHLLAVVLPRLAEAAREAGEPQQFDATLQELIRLGVGNHAEIAYAAIVGGYYDDPVNPNRILLCPASCSSASVEVDATLEVQLGCVTETREPA